MKWSLDLFLGDKVPGQCEEALEDCECDVMSVQQCCIIYNVMHSHQPYYFEGGQNMVLDLLIQGF
jgi:hypothetical protein